MQAAIAFVSSSHFSSGACTSDQPFWELLMPYTVSSHFTRMWVKFYLPYYYYYCYRALLVLSSHAPAAAPLHGRTSNATAPECDYRQRLCSLCPCSHAPWPNPVTCPLPRRPFPCGRDCGRLLPRRRRSLPGSRARQLGRRKIRGHRCGRLRPAPMYVRPCASRWTTNPSCRSRATAAVGRRKPRPSAAPYATTAAGAAQAAAVVAARRRRRRQRQQIGGSGARQQPGPARTEAAAAAAPRPGQERHAGGGSGGGRGWLQAHWRVHRGGPSAPASSAGAPGAAGRVAGGPDRCGVCCFLLASVRGRSSG